MHILKSIKTQLALFLVCFGLFLAIKDRDGAFVVSTIIAVIASVGTETIIRFFKDRAFFVTGSSVITGLIIGFVLSSDTRWWLIACVSLSAILCKYIIRFKHRHICNPAAAGIFLITVLSLATTQWRGTYQWYILVPFGLYFSWRTRKLQVLLGYYLISLLLFGIQALIQKVPVTNIFGYFSYFFIFIMLVEPKTTPNNTLGKIIFGIGVAVAIFVLTASKVRFDAELLSLLILNMCVPLLNKLK